MTCPIYLCVQFSLQGILSSLDRYQVFFFQYVLCSWKWRQIIYINTFNLSNDSLNRWKCNTHEDKAQPWHHIPHQLTENDVFFRAKLSRKFSEHRTVLPLVTTWPTWAKKSSKTSRSSSHHLPQQMSTTHINIFSSSSLFAEFSPWPSKVYDCNVFVCTYPWEMVSMYVFLTNFMCSYKMTHADTHFTDLTGSLEIHGWKIKTRL